ncbi:Inactive ubiquitin carboxyl-terminal hydrolase 17-like protein [Seminavis robusta]|uniref:Ubiquitin carboxyl-terminal hydrolase n=1 Tax=Seminavis robusta TaxID=568900 RepID=A0A9N8HES6_9STRA|nr:Inactive ubiquitin carboxyl-terminal hydrolase 17-like protein [Seminavis robusta]|eukprot:Sro399_g134800.1 Inactive ubiquitin carboxyl-terminal hydrolase 17-like protein (974) ;mRNA; r:7308-10331
MGKNSAKKRKRQERKASNGNHWSKLSDEEDGLTHGRNGSSAPNSAAGKGAKKLENDTAGEGTGSSPDDLGSEKRSRRRLDFVYPKQNGTAKPYFFIGKTTICNNKASPSSTNQQHDVVELVRTKESIDDILETSKRKKKEESSKAPPENHADVGRLRSASTDEEMEGKLSGMSVEDAVRDKKGLRPRANSTDGELNLPRRGLCDEVQVLHSHKWNIVGLAAASKKPVGFQNLGNTCFLNSTLQCLVYLPPFCQSLLAMPARDSHGSKPSQGKRITAMLRLFFQKVHGNQQGGAIAPHAVVKMLPSLGTSGGRGYKFRPGRQEDAHELLVHLLDGMHNGELKEAGINQRASGWRDRLPVPRLDETTFVHRIFGGYLRSQLRCSKCGYCSNTYDPFLDLALEVSKKGISNVAEAFQEFTRKETLDSDNRWKCGGCNKRVRANKVLSVFRPPLSLCVQMKRFTFGGNSGFSSGYSRGMFGGNKITKPIRFPAEMKLPLSDGRSCPYALTGVVIHVGSSSHSGHYTAYVKKPKADGSYQWYHMDDSFVEAVSEKTVLQEKDAYLLFYCRTEVKLEFPEPPRRGSMTAKEATEHGRARARARADSLTKLDMEKDAASVLETTAPPTCQVSTDKKTSKIVGETKTAVMAKNDNLQKDVRASPAQSSGPSKAPKTAASKNTSADESNKPPKRPGSSKKSSSGSTASQESSESSSSDSSSDDSSDDSSSGEDDNAKKTDNQPSASDNRKAEQVNDKPQKSNTARKGSSAAAELDRPKDRKLEGLDAVKVSEESKHSEANQTSSVSKAKAPHDTPKNKKSPNSRNAVIVLDRGKGREKLSVMTGRPAKRRWIPNTLGRTKSGNDYELLGNRTVGKWDDSNDATKPSTDSNDSDVSKARSNIVDSMERNKNAKKRKTYLDRWDATLDRGRTKKVKEKREDATTDNSGAFQRVLSGLQRMNHGRPKGFLGSVSSSKKKKQNKKR